MEKGDELTEVRLDVKEGLLSANFDDDQDEVKKAFENTRTKTWRRLLQLGRPELVLMILGTISLIIASVTILAIPLFVGKIIDSAFNPKDDAQETLRNGVIQLVVVVTISSIFGGLRGYMYTIAGERIVARLRQELYSRILIQEIGFFDETKTGELISRLASDCTVLQNTITINVSMGLRQVITCITSLFMLFYLSWKMTLVTLAFLPFILIAAILIGRYVKRISKEFQEALASASDTASEALTNVRTVRNFSQEQYEINNYSNSVNVTFQLAKKRAVLYGVMLAITGFIANIAIGAVLWYGGSMVISRTFSPGDLTSFIIYSIGVAASIGTLSSLYTDFMKALGSSERVFELLDRKPKVHWSGGMQLEKIQGNLRLENVHFHYPSRRDVEVLKGVNLELNAGQVVALVGPSGGGKTTIVSLIEMFYYPTEGSITLDGRNIKTMEPASFRRHIGIVSQEPLLFGMSIAKNIAYGKPDVSMDTIIQYAKKANAHEFISAFPEGYDTIVGERGLKLSGGQKQRVAIARALLMDPTILLLDEATSALDSESEYLVKDALDKMMTGRTVRGS
eukprot:TRINITY_DN2746_c0_g1_i5.p1 TRINITY_DN2746_c0_g1~~TRINITY_DN2746_c0_g1_i5.p1  ORF type:complete len:568 (+),score=139.29 TRINITY_DN2746_c0_g1_i5:47-1750(+)